MIEAIIDSQKETDNNKQNKKVSIVDEKQSTPQKSVKSNRSNKSARSIISNLGQQNFVPIPNLVKKRTTALSTKSAEQILYSTKSFCTPWLLFILLVFVTTLSVGGAYYYLWFRSSNKVSKINISNPQSTSCRPGYFYDKGKCIKCPDQSEWTGNQCKVKEDKSKVNQLLSNNKKIKQNLVNTKINKFTPNDLKHFIHFLPKIINNKQTHKTNHD